VGGTATNNGDYDFIPATITFPAGEATVVRTITPSNDVTVEGAETVVVTLQDGANYDVGAPAGATVTIAAARPATSTTTPRPPPRRQTRRARRQATSTTAQTSSSVVEHQHDEQHVHHDHVDDGDDQHLHQLDRGADPAPDHDDPAARRLRRHAGRAELRLDRVPARSAAGGGARRACPREPRTEARAERTKAMDRTDDALAACGSADTKKARSRLAQVKKALVQYAHRLKGRAARKKLDTLLREGFLAAGDAIAPDVTALRSGLACP
jgi:hypothetical protein